MISMDAFLTSDICFKVCVMDLVDNLIMKYKRNIPKKSIKPWYPR